MTFFGLKEGQDLENQAANPTKNSQNYPLETFINLLYPNHKQVELNYSMKT